MLVLQEWRDFGDCKVWEMFGQMELNILLNYSAEHLPGKHACVSLTWQQCIRQYSAFISANWFLLKWEEFLQASTFQGRSTGKWRMMFSEASWLSHNFQPLEMSKCAVHPVKPSTLACASGPFLRELTSGCDFNICVLRFLAYCTHSDIAICFLSSHHWVTYWSISLVDDTFLEGNDLSQTSLRFGAIVGGCLLANC